MTNSDTIRCLIVEEVDGKPAMAVKQVARSSFGDGEVVIDISFSSLNFKDTLACQGHRGIIRRLPHVPGIDLAGIVSHSANPDFQPGESVLVTGYDLGQGHWGGWSELACVPAAWIVRLPQGLSLRESMFIGTAGFTAAQCLVALQRNGVTPQSGPVAVTGATGGVGSLAIRLLAQTGYEVAAVTGKSGVEDTLRKIGATKVIPREQLAAADSSRPMLTAQWAGAIDTVGGSILTTLLKSTQYGGCVAACGLVAGHQLEMTVYPFLLRGVSLCGVASADCPKSHRLEIWDKLSGPWKPAHTDVFSREVGLEQLPDLVNQMSRGEVAGRVVVNCKS